ncbi:MAG: hypothetical protein MUE85_02380 [Microscillaceae bacterium]|jgi:hypothetical protein|nr:hypothetical protein [Microscillaceae bacterium]
MKKFAYLLVFRKFQLYAKPKRIYAGGLDSLPYNLPEEVRGIKTHN